jgi:transcriptional regulator with XRE-family HTH domain
MQDHRRAGFMEKGIVEGSSIGGIASLRIRLGMSQSEFAERMGVSQTTVSRWESGRQIPGAGIRAQLSELRYQLDLSRGTRPEIALVEHSPFPMAIVSEDWRVVAMSDPLLARHEGAGPEIKLERLKKRSSADMEQALSILRAHGFFEAKVPACRIVARGFVVGRDPDCFEALCTPLVLEGKVCRLTQYRFLADDEFRERRNAVGLVTFLGRDGAPAEPQNSVMSRGDESGGVL